MDTSGTVAVNGTGGSGSGNGNYGVFIGSAGQITAVGSGTVTVNGSGGAGSGSQNYGVMVTDTNARITSTGGVVSVTGTGTATSHAVRLANSGAITSGSNASITVTADSLNVDAPTLGSINAGTGIVTIQPRTAGTLVDLGGADVLTGTPLTLGLTAVELDRVTAGTVQIGNSNSGTITISAGITRPAATDVNLTTGGNIVFNPGSINTAGGALTLSPGSTGSLQPITSGTDVSVSAGTLGFASGSDLAIVINGTTVNSQYRQLNVVGAVDLTGADLVLSGSHSPVGGQSFTIVNNDGTDAIIGTFNGLLEGAVIPNFLGSGLSATVSYVGGTDNNDVVLSVISSSNQPPAAVADSGDVPEDGPPVYILLTGNDTDPDASDDLEISNVDTGGTFGLVTINPDHDSVSYDPDGQFEFLAVDEIETDTFSYTVSDGHGGTSTATVLVTIHGENDAPRVASDNASLTVSEGQFAVNSGTFSDVDSSDDVAITASKGMVSKSGINEGTWNWFYSGEDDEPVDTVTITADDSHGGIATATFELTVVNVPPTIALSGNAFVNEGAVSTLYLGAVSDPGPDTVTEYIVNWGDGNTESSASPGNQTHVYSDDAPPPATKTIKVSLVDEDGVHADVASRNVLVRNVAPSGITVTNRAFTGSGSAATFTAAVSFTDPGADTWTATIDYGDSTIITQPLEASRTFNLSHDYTQPGAYTAAITIVDDDGGTVFKRGNTAIAIGSPQADQIKMRAGSVIIELNGQEIAHLEDIEDVFVWGGDGGDRMSVEPGIDLPVALLGGPGDDSLIGGSGPTILDGGDGDDILQDGGGTNTIIGGGGNNSFIPGGGTNTFSATPGATIPEVFSDQYYVVEDNTLMISPALGVLANDSAVNNGPLSASLVSGPAHGNVTLNVDGSFSYIPNVNFYGTDSFSYRANDVQAYSNVASVTIAVSPVNDAPVLGAIGNSSVDEHATLSVKVTATDQDLPAQTLSYAIVGGADEAQFSLNSTTGDVSFKVPPDYENPTDANHDNIYELTVEASDGPDQNQTVTITATDGDGESHTTTFNLIVSNVAPTLAVVSDQTMDQGRTLNLVDIGMFSDPGFEQETFTFVINGGDGRPVDTGAPTIDTPGSPGVATSGSFDGSHVYAATGTFTVIVTVADDDGGVHTETFHVTARRSMFVLNTTACAALNLSGNAKLTAPGSVVVNSSCPDRAIDAAGNARVTASHIDVVGGVRKTGNAVLSPNPTTSIQPVPDPLAALVAPAGGVFRGSANWTAHLVVRQPFQADRLA